MTSKAVVAFIFLFVLVLGLVANSVHMTWFAAKGARYTAVDGAREREERISADRQLAERITVVELECRSR
jgi:hypothetical protein